ncbi:MAG: hypothetical protein HY290_25130 [Planctomycetia bacterium]|nr:hypothetical protein [Planctomycetia bacterium]
MKMTIKRKKLFVSRTIQGRLLARMAKYWAFLILAGWHGLFLVDFVRHGIPNMLGRGPSMSPLQFYFEFSSRNATLLVAAAVILPVILWDMLKLTHQIAGPLVRFQNTLKKMSNGEPVRHVELRQGDLLGELQDSFNEFLASGNYVARPSSPSGNECAANGCAANAQEAAILSAVHELQAGLDTVVSEPAGRQESAASGARG